MFNRRRFLGSTGFGMLAFSNPCQPILAQIPASGATEFQDERLEIKARLKSKKDRLLGYPVNMNTPPAEFFSWRQALCQAGIGQFSFNNVGNPYKKSPIPYSTHDFERDTIMAFAKVYRFPSDDIWGFLSNSGTDSNMHGMYIGRTILKAASGRLPKAYFTRETHYSVQILADLLGMEKVVVATRPDGGMDPDDLSRNLVMHADAPALVVATIGTTFRGAIDRLDVIQPRLRGYPNYVHLDAALFGGYLPFTPFAREVAFESGTGGDSRYDSIAVSCHKFFGFPSPAGLFITTQSRYDQFDALFSKIHNPEYIHQVPGTITCSRDAVKPAEFFYFTSPAAIAMQEKDASRMLDNTTYLLDRMRADYPQLAPVRSNAQSNTIYFRDPGEKIVSKYSLATMNLPVDRKPVKHAHVIVMPHVSTNVIDEFLADLKAV